MTAMATASTLLRLGLLLALVPPSLTVGQGWAARAAPRSELAGAGTIARSGAASVSGQVSCEPNDEIEVAVNLTQGRTTAQASSRGRCEASLYGFTVQAQPQGGRFAPGMAQASAQASFMQNGQVVATHQWCLTGGVMLLAASS